MVDSVKDLLHLIKRPSPGREIVFGERVWYILDVKETDEVLLIMKESLKRGAFDTDNNGNWEKSEIRQWLNNDFYNTFSEKDKKRIVSTPIQTFKNQWYGTFSNSNFVDDFVFLLSIEEVLKYFPFGKGDTTDDYKKHIRWERDNADNNYKLSRYPSGWILHNDFDTYRVALYRGKPDWWWLRTPGNSSKTVTCVDDLGFIWLSGSAVDRIDGCIRPAMWIKM